MLMNDEHENTTIATVDEALVLAAKVAELKPCAEAVRALLSRLATLPEVPEELRTAGEGRVKWPASSDVLRTAVEAAKTAAISLQCKLSAEECGAGMPLVANLQGALRSLLQEVDAVHKQKA